MRFRLALAALVALGLALVGWALFLGESEEEAVRRRLDAISEAVRIDPQEGVVARALRVRGGFDASFAKTAKIVIPELGSALGREELATLATGATQRWSSGELGWSDVVVKIQSTTAHVDATAKLTGSSTNRGPGEEERRLALELTKVDGEWVVTVLAVVSDVSDEDEGEE